jgi:hypothetical protein
MARISPGRAFLASLGVVLTAQLALLICTSAVYASNSGTAHYEYHVTGVDYHATGQVSGGRFQGECTPAEDALWEGDVTSDDSELRQLVKLGDGSLKVLPHGTSGDIEAKFFVESKFSASHRETTACENGSESASSTLSCMNSSESEQRVLVDISGGVGDRVKLAWTFSLEDGSGSQLVPNTFSCVEPYVFPIGICTTKAGLNKLTSRTVTLPFDCLYTTSTPPAGRNYTKYAAVAHANGALHLKRTKQH